MAEPITLDELFAELQRLGVPAERGGDDGHTLRELAELWNCGTEKATTQLRRFLNAGVAQNGRAYRTAIDGTRRQVPVYRFVLPKITAKKKR